MTAHEIREKIDRLSRLSPGLLNGDFLLTWRHGDDAIQFVLLAAEILEDLTRANLSARVFESGLGVAIFRDRSTRTRYAFKSACNLLGLATEEFDEGSSQVAHGETVRETAAMIGLLTEVIGIRDDMVPGEGHRYMTEVSASLEEAHREGAILGWPSVVNLQCDLDHPTQSLADLRHLSTIFGGASELKGRKIAISWAYSPSYAKPMSVPQGAITLLSRFGMDITLAHPPGYELMDEPVAEARRLCAESGGSLSVVHSMEDAFRGADIVYPKSWGSADVMRERTRLARGEGGEGARTLADLEKEALAQNARHKEWTCDEARMALTRGGRAQYLHCLPADVTGVSCAAGEVSRAVFEHARLSTYREASYKPFVIAAMILGTRLKDPAAALGRALDVSAPRVRG